MHISDDAPNASTAPMTSEEMKFQDGVDVKPLLVAVVVMILAGLAWKTFSPRGATADWLQSVEAGMSEAQLGKKPVLVLFTADWCPPCKRLKGESLPDPELAAYLDANYVLVKVDLTNRRGPNNAVAEQFNVQSIPRLFIVSPDGYELAQTGGFIPPYELLDWVKRYR